MKVQPTLDLEMPPLTRLDSLAAYVPIDRRHALTNGESLPDRTAGAALFADVSGFTPLTAALAQELGPKRGAEEVLVFLNPVFDALIVELYRYGGTVIGFAGDSITCWLDEDDGRRAIACGLAMQDVMRPYADLKTPGGTPVALHLKVAIAVGPARRFAVGMDTILKIDVLAGNTVMRMAMLEEIAQRGEVIVEEAVADRLATWVEIGEWRSGEAGLRGGVVIRLVAPVEPAPWPALSPDALAEDLIRPWLLPPVYARIKEGRSFLAELRPQVTSLFLRFTGLDYDGDDLAGEKLDAFICWVETVINRYDGYLIQLTVGDKGSYLLAGFGAPVAHEDNAVRAVAAALDLRARATSFEGINEVQVGLSAGTMWTGACGGAGHRTYSVMGNETNMAARLMQKAAPGQILVTGQVVHSGRLTYHFQSLESIQVKGRNEPLPVWEVLGRQQQASSEWSLFVRPVVGRRNELALLNAALAAVQAGQGRVVRLGGEAGMGKSHLAAQFSQSAQAAGHGVRLAAGAPQSITRTATYQPWRQIFRTLLELEDCSDQEAMASIAALAAQHSDWSLRLPLLGDLLELPIPDNATTTVLDAGTRQKALFSLVVEMVQTWARQKPLLLVIENAHWMDEASLALAQTIARQAVSTAPVLFLLVHRTEMAMDLSVLSDLASPAQQVSVALDAMPQDDVAELVRERLGAPATPLLLSVLQELAQGNPFFIDELIDAMQQGGQIIQQDDGRWQMAPEILDILRAATFLIEQDGQAVLKAEADFAAISIGVPDSIQSVLLSRLDRLPESHKVTLKVSSVIGHYFNLFVLARAHPDDKGLAELRAEAEAMEAAEVVHEEEPERSIYAFRHHSMQEVAYETLLYAQRLELHQKVAQVLAELTPDATIPIAHHAFLGEVWPLSLRYNRQAGEQTMRLYANRQSIEFFQRALQSAQHLPEAETAEDRKRIHLALGELMVSTGRYDAGDEQLLTALTLALTLGDRESEALACRWLGRSHELRADYPAALEWLDRGLATLRGMDSTEEAEISLIAGLIHSRQGQYEQTVLLCERSLQVADRLRDAAVRARAYNLMGIVDRRRGDGEAAINRFRQSLAQYEALDNVYGLATSHNLIANGLFMQGQWRESDEQYRQSLALFTQMGDLYNQVFVNNNLGGSALKQGRLDQALGFYQKAMRQLEQIGGSPFVIGALFMNLGNTRLQLREIDLAMEELRRALESFEQAQARDFLPETYGYLAEASLVQDDVDAAEAHGKRSLELAQELNMPREEGHTLRILGEIALARAQFGDAHRFLTDSYDVLTTAGDEYESAKTQLALAALFARQQRLQEAAAALAECCAVFDRLGASLDLERARQLLDQLM